MTERVVIGDCTLYRGDCREILPTLGAVEAVVTDPPYGIGIAANPVRQRHAKSDWDNAPPTAAVFDSIRGGSRWQIIWGGNYFPLPPSQCFLIWDKVQPENFSLSMCEYAWTNMKKPAKLFRRHVTSYEKDHPTQKPIELMMWCIEQLPPGSGVICDMYMGAGTTGVACAKLGRRFVGIELEPRYFDVACRRIEEAYRQADFFAAPAAVCHVAPAPLLAEAA